MRVFDVGASDVPFAGLSFVVNFTDPAYATQQSFVFGANSFAVSTPPPFSQCSSAEGGPLFFELWPSPAITRQVGFQTICSQVLEAADVA